MTASDEARQNPLYAPMLVITAGCLIALIAFGIRSSMGFFTIPISETNGWGRSTFSLAMALQNLVWGFAQPFAGMLADKWGSMRVIIVGALIYAAGTVLMIFADNVFLITLTGGLMMGTGIAMTSFSLIMASLGRVVPEEKRSWAFGIATAASSAGQFVFAPLGQAFIAAFGWQIALVWLAAILLLILPLALPLGNEKGGAAAGSLKEVDFGIAETLRRAFAHSSYVMLIMGFFVCGFQVAFIGVHLPSYLGDGGLTPGVAGWCLGLIGLFNIIGAYLSGLFGARHSRRYGLTVLYLVRSVVITGFLLLPLSAASALVFSASIGLLWLSTVPLTMGLVMMMFGTRYMATLYGFVFLSHQLGSFVGVWLGGHLYDTTGSYDLVWWIAVALGLFAAAMHWPIREEQAASFATS